MNARLPFEPLREVIVARGGIGQVLTAAGLEYGTTTYHMWRQRWQIANRTGRLAHATADEWCVHILRVPPETLWPHDWDADVPDRLTICEIRGCGRPHKARGWCALHYQRWRRHGQPGPAEPLPPPGRPRLLGDCRLENCARPARCRDLCNTHYLRWLKHGDPLKVGRPGNPSWRQQVPA